MTDKPIIRTAIDVVRESRFHYVVVERYSGGLDGEWNPGHWFRWTAVRHARKLARVPEPVTVLRIDAAEKSHQETQP